MSPVKTPGIIHHNKDTVPIIPSINNTENPTIINRQKIKTNIDSKTMISFFM